MYIYQAFALLSFISIAAAGQPQKNYNVSMTVPVTTGTLEPIKTVIWTSCGFGPGEKNAGCGVHTTTLLPKTSSLPAQPPSVTLQSQPHHYANNTREPKPTTFIFLNTSALVLTTNAPLTTAVNTNTANITTSSTIVFHNTTTPGHALSTTLPANSTLSTTTTAGVDFFNSTFTTTYAHTSLSHSNYSYSSSGNYSRPLITNGHVLAAAETDSAAAFSEGGSTRAASTNGVSKSSKAPHLSVSLMGVIIATLFLSVTIN